MGEITHNKSDIVILHGSEDDTFVYIFKLYLEPYYINIRQKTNKFTNFYAYACIFTFISYKIDLYT